MEQRYPNFKMIYQGFFIKSLYETVSLLYHTYNHRYTFVFN